MLAMRHPLLGVVRVTNQKFKNDLFMTFPLSDNGIGTMNLSKLIVNE